MKIELKEIKVRATALYDLAEYDNNTLYLVTDENNQRHIIAVFNAAVLSVSVPFDFEFQEIKDYNVLQESKESVSTETMLKAIAIVQKPELIKDISDGFFEKAVG